jgi:hypothetical protein
MFLAIDCPPMFHNAPRPMATNVTAQKKNALSATPIERN